MNLQQAPEQAANRSHFQTAEAISRYSRRELFPEEQYLFRKYYHRGDKVLDLACGAGRTTINLFEMGCDVLGLDVADALIAAAREKFPDLPLDLGDYCAIASPDEAWDHVLISFNGLDYAVLEPDRMRALRESYRVLKRGGTLIFSSHNIRALIACPFYLHFPVWRLKHVLHGFRRNARIDDHGLHTFYGSSRWITQETQSVGFRLEEKVGWRALRHPGLLLEYFSPYLHYVFRKP